MCKFPARNFDSYREPWIHKNHLEFLEALMRGRGILAKSILDIRNELNDNIGKPVKLVAYESRNRVTEKTGTLSSIYPSVFVVEIGEDQDSVDRVSYNYIDILTGSVELNFE